MAATLNDEDADLILDSEVVTGLTVRQCLAQLWANTVGESDTHTDPGKVIYFNPDGSESHRATFDMLTGERGAPEYPEA
jgi:hypothetical protein